MRVYITGVAHLGAAGKDPRELLGSLERGDRGIAPLSLFSTSALADAPLPVAEVAGLTHDAGLPRTHALARAAAAQLRLDAPPDAVVLGGTTGGMPLSERLLRSGEVEPGRFARHGTGTVAADLARELGCPGIALTISTACSSGAAALKVGLELIRRGLCRTVLAGGVDALCHLTYHGFRLLKLIDPHGARPLDSGRRGMSVGEAAGLLLLTGAGDGAPPSGALAELRGAGASCDAHHATMPLPGGEGARAAMERALADAGLEPGEVDYINLHGTGTVGNDASEAAAIRGLYADAGPPPLSSTKGITGHPLAAAGAVEAVACALCLQRGLLPGNAGLEQLDPELGITPLPQSRAADPAVMLSNSFGFGGNNASVVLTHPDHSAAPGPASGGGDLTLQVLAEECISAVGGAAETLAALDADRPAVGLIPAAALKEGLPPRLIRRLKRLPRMALALARRLVPEQTPPRSIFFGTGWGPLSETHDFLVELFASEEDLSSPTDFVGSVHNAPAGQLAMRYKARGINLTATGGHSSFEQCLLMAALTATADDEPLLLLGADEHHPRFSPLLDPAAGESEGGGALLLRRPPAELIGDEVWITPLAMAGAAGGRFPLSSGHYPEPEVTLYCGPERTAPPDIGLAGFSHHPVRRCSPTLGAHASASAQAAALAARLVRQGRHAAVLLVTAGEPVAATLLWRGAPG